MGLIDELTIVQQDYISDNTLGIVPGQAQSDSLKLSFLDDFAACDKSQEFVPQNFVDRDIHVGSLFVYGNGLKEKNDH